jgi:hypothetical protein
MVEWKSRQEYFHQNFVINDYFDNMSSSDKPIVYREGREQILKYALEYFEQDQSELIYPAKSYCVAMIYSFLLHQYFKTDLRLALADADLLFNNDPYFEPYTDHNAFIYEALIYKTKSGLPLNLSQVKVTYDYFHKEFLIENKLF